MAHVAEDKSFRMSKTFRMRRLSFRLLVVFILSTIGMLLLGLWVDRTMGTAPLAMLVLMIPGILFGTVVTYRMVREANEQIAPLLEPTTSDPAQSRDELRGGE